MTFPARLTELLEKATKGPVTVNPISAHPSFGYAQHPEYQFQARHGDVALYAYLVNHAEAIRDLVVAAQEVMKEMPSCVADRSTGDRMIAEALAKLEES